MFQRLLFLLGWLEEQRFALSWSAASLARPIAVGNVQRRLPQPADGRSELGEVVTQSFVNLSQQLMGWVIPEFDLHLNRL